MRRGRVESLTAMWVSVLQSKVSAYKALREVLKLLAGCACPIIQSRWSWEFKLRERIDRSCRWIFLKLTSCAARSTEAVKAASALDVDFFKAY